MYRLLIACLALALPGLALADAEESVKRAANATKHGIEKGQEYMERGVKRGAEAVEYGFEKAGEAVNKVAKKAGLPDAPPLAKNPPPDPAKMP